MLADYAEEGKEAFATRLVETTRDSQPRGERVLGIRATQNRYARG